MSFEWNAVKARSNQRKHGIDFDTAQQVFADPNRVELYNGMHDGEERWSVIGDVGTQLIVVVIYTLRGIDDEIHRIISARRANKNEQRTYYQIKF